MNQTNYEAFFIKRTKQTIALITGVFITTCVIRLVYINNAVWQNYYSGLDPLSAIAHVPIFTAIELLIGIFILLALKLKKITLIDKPCEYLIFGIILGMGGSGSIMRIWFYFEYIEIVVMLVVIFSASIMAIGEPSK